MKFKKILLVLMLAGLFLLTACTATSVDNNDDNSTTGTDDDTVGDTEYSTEDESMADLSDISVHECSITLTDDDWQATLDDPTAEQFYSATLVYDGTTLENVAFRTKGNSTLTSVANSTSERYSFKVKTNKYVDDQYLDGSNEFVLNNSYNDPSYLREYITYGASSYLGLITPETEFVQLTINGEAYGLYLYVESYDDTFVEKYSDSSDTELYKADGDKCTLTTSQGSTGFENKYADDDDLENIDALVTALSETTADNTTEIESILDVESVLKWAAISYTFGNYDSYIGPLAHNYFLLYTDGQFHMVGWDYNMSFGSFTEDGGASLQISVDDLYLSTTASDRPLVAKLLAIDEYNEKFLDYVTSVKNWASDYDTALTAMATEISEYVENDATAFYTIDEFWSNINGTDMTINDVQGSTIGGGGIGDRPDMGGRPGMDQDVTSEDNIVTTSLSNTDNNIATIALPGGSVSQDVISINDYIRLRLAN